MSPGTLLQEVPGEEPGPVFGSIAGGYKKTRLLTLALQPIAGTRKRGEKNLGKEWELCGNGMTRVSRQ